MIIREMNEGAKIPYTVNGTSICFDQDLTLNLARRQKAWPVSIDICSDQDGALVIGVATGLYYVAKLDLPAKQYEQPEDPEASPTLLPLNMEQVTLSLWEVVGRG